MQTLVSVFAANCSPHPAWQCTYGGGETVTMLSSAGPRATARGPAYSPELIRR